MAHIKGASALQTTASANQTNHLGEEASSPWAISRISGEFVSFDLEQRYRASIVPGATRFLRIALGIWLLVTVANLFTGYIFYGLTMDLLIVDASRLLVIACISWVLWQAYRNPGQLMTGVAVTVLEIVGFTAFFLIVYMRADYSAYWLGVLMVLMLAVYVFVPNRLMLAAVAVIYAMLGMLITLLLIGASLGQFLGAFFMLLLPTVMGHISSFRLHLIRRQHFALWQQQLDVNQQLQDEIQRRRKLEIELTRQATTDPLTGLANRREFSRQFEHEVQRIRRHPSQLVLAILDIDHFKVVNDRYGHEAGDQALIKLSRTLETVVRENDLVSRLGGEEFALLLPETTIEQAMTLAERVRQSIEAQKIHSGDVIFSVTATIGLAALREGEPSLATAMREADRALYAGKESGRNRVVEYTPALQARNEIKA